MACSRWVTLSDEVEDILLRWWEWQVLTEDWLDVLSVDDSSITLVEELEALKCLGVSTGLFDALKPVVCDDVFDEVEIDSVAAAKFVVRSLEFVIDVTRSHLVEAEVLENVPEESFGDDACSFLIVVGEALFEIVHDVSWESSGVALRVVHDFGDVNFLGGPLHISFILI